MARVKESYSITRIGTGRPDNLGKMISSRPVITGNMRKWSDLWTGTIDAGDVTEVSAYTVPLKWRLNLGGGIVSCDSSCIQKVIWVGTPGILGDFRYDVTGIVVFGPTSASIVLPEDTLTYCIFNNDIVEHDFSVSLVGLLEQVGEE